MNGQLAGSIVSVRTLRKKHWWQEKEVAASITCKCGRKAELSASILIAVEGLPLFRCLGCQTPVSLSSAEVLGRVVHSDYTKAGERN
jgi:hypothetical protein